MSSPPSSPPIQTSIKWESHIIYLSPQNTPERNYVPKLNSPPSNHLSLFNFDLDREDGREGEELVLGRMEEEENTSEVKEVQEGESKKGQEVEEEIVFPPSSQNTSTSRQSFFLSLSLNIKKNLIHTLLPILVFACVLTGVIISVISMVHSRDVKQSPTDLEDPLGSKGGSG